MPDFVDGKASSPRPGVHTFQAGTWLSFIQRLGGAGLALVVAWPLMPVLNSYDATLLLVFVPAGLYGIGVPLSYPLEYAARRAASNRSRLTIYALGGAISGAAFAGLASLIPGFALVGAPLGAFLAVAAAWGGPRLSSGTACVAAAHGVLVAVVGFMVP